MEIEVEGETEVECKCPHCKKKFYQTVTYCDVVDVDIEPMYNEGYD